MDENKKKHVPNVSGSFQIVDNHRKDDVKDMEKQTTLDEESLYYARLFMED
jgi:hypothetical protein